MDFKEYQKKMSDKYGNAEELYKKINPRYLEKEFLSISKDNVIRVKENIPITYWDMTKEISKEIEVDGERYKRVIQESKAKQFYAFLLQNENDYYEYDFELLDLKYKFIRYRLPGHSSPCLYCFPESDNQYVNFIYHLADWGFLDDRILRIEFGKFKNRHNVDELELKENDYSIHDIEIKIHNFSYGWNNDVKYYISLNSFLKLEYSKIKKYAFEYVDFFKKIGLCLKITNYQERINWYNRYANQIKQAEKDIELMRSNEHRVIEFNNMDILTRYKSKSQCYIIKDENTGLYKIGKSSDPLSREKTLQSEKPTLKAVKIFEQDHESELHKLYEKQRVRGEWFKLNNIQLEYVCRNYN